MKKIILSFCLLCFIACTKSYDINQRYSISLQLVDRNNNPIPDVEVDLYFVYDALDLEPRSYFNVLSKGLFWPTGGEDADLISYTTSDENGMVNLNFPIPNNSFTNLRLVAAEDNETYNDFSLVQIKESDFIENALAIPTLQLVKQEELVGLQITSGLENSGYILESYQVDVAEYSILPFENLSSTPNFTQFTYFSVFKNQQVTIDYTLRNTNENPTQTIQLTDQITVGEEAVEYQIQVP